MKELINLPSSVKAQIERANVLAQQERKKEVQNSNLPVPAHSPTEVHVNQELASLLQAVELGFTQISLTESEMQTKSESAARRFLGIKYAEDITTVTTTRDVSRTIRFT